MRVAFSRTGAGSGTTRTLALADGTEKMARAAQADADQPRTGLIDAYLSARHRDTPVPDSEGRMRAGLSRGWTAAGPEAGLAPPCLGASGRYGEWSPAASQAPA